MGNELDEVREWPIIAMLKENKDLFAWTTIDMPRVHLKVMSHRLAIFKEA